MPLCSAFSKRMRIDNSILQEDSRDNDLLARFSSVPKIDDLVLREIVHGALCMVPQTESILLPWRTTTQTLHCNQILQGKYDLHCSMLSICVLVMKVKVPQSAVLANRVSLNIILLNISQNIHCSSRVTLLCQVDQMLISENTL